MDLKMLHKALLAYFCHHRKRLRGSGADRPLLSPFVNVIRSHEAPPLAFYVRTVTRGDQALTTWAGDVG